ncbi:MAG: TetR/AcrR family transcriptional regulator [Actinomycetota bacterium]
MSRARTRPTREETRERLLAASAKVFAERGIAATSIEDICDEAGFSRGAFYSNFANKDDLVLELLEEHLAENESEIERLYEQTESPEAFLLAMESDDRRRTAALGAYNMLGMELTLYALRDPANRPRLVEHQHRLREMNREVIDRIAEQVGRPHPMPVEDVVTLVRAFDDGLSLHSLIEPGVYRPTQFSETMVALQRLWLSAPDPDDSPA